MYVTMETDFSIKYGKIEELRQKIKAIQKEIDKEDSTAPSWQNIFLASDVLKGIEVVKPIKAFPDEGYLDYDDYYDVWGTWVERYEFAKFLLPFVEDGYLLFEDDFGNKEGFAFEDGKIKYAEQICKIAIEGEVESVNRFMVHIS